MSPLPPSHAQESVHYMEPSYLRSRDLHLYLDARERLLHRLAEGQVPEEWS